MESDNVRGVQQPIRTVKWNSIMWTGFVVSASVVLFVIVFGVPAVAVTEALVGLSALVAILAYVSKWGMEAEIARQLTADVPKPAAA